MIGDLIDTVANIEYGILIAVVLTVIVMVVITSMNDKRDFNPLSYIIALVLCAILTFQMSRLIGACQISNAASQVNSIIGMVSPSLSKYISSSTSSEVGWFIARRVLWSVLFIGVAVFGIWTTMNKRTKHSSRPSGAISGRRYTRPTNRRR